MVFILLVTTYIIFPSSTEADFTVIFSAGIGAEKKKPSAKLDLIPDSGKKANLLGIYSSLISRWFFFSCQIPRKKKTVNLSPSFLYLLDDRQICLW